jgi:hypothetical protein
MVQEVYSESLEKAFERLAQLDSAHNEIGMYIMKAHGGALYNMDFLAFAALNRSKAHIAGFTSLLKAKNLICAGALLRLQLDTAMRFYAAFLVDDPHSFAFKVMKGEKIRKLRDRDKNLMTDSYLVEMLGTEYAWVPRVYDKTSGYVHLSSTHIFSTLTPKESGDDEAYSFEVKIGSGDKDLPDWLYTETVDAFSASTDILLRYVHGWAFTKDNPELVKRAREMRDTPAGA